ncbi:MAG: hypothetical protein PHC61_04120 [Chitinivibrionales bacterium]|nr:hypothetical protein [Chitinivibrionales bacterium]
MKWLKEMTIIGLCVCGNLPAHTSSDSTSGGALSGTAIPGTISLPNFSARLAVGFNYDFLRAPTDVSFEYSKGYLGFDIPFEYNANPLDLASNVGAGIDSLFSDSTKFTNGGTFKPSMGVRQNPNTTVRVDIPMLGGVASFSNTQNVFLNYLNTLGSADLKIKPDSMGGGMSLLMRGTVNVPVDATLGWESMTFGYAYKVNKNFIMAVDLSRHIFRLDLQGKMDADIYGNFSIKNDSAGINISQIIDYNSQKVYGSAQGHYEAQAWAPTFGLKLWRFTLTSRFGIDAKADGYFNARYSLPFFIDPKTFQPSIDFNKPSALMKPEVYNRLLNNETDSIWYNSKTSAEWKMPQGHTIAFDIIRDKLTFSYTKTIGDLSIYHKYEGKDGINNTADDYVDLDVKIRVDNVMVLTGNFWSSFFNVGLFGFDISLPNQQNLLYNQLTKAGLSQIMIDKLPMVPILNFGSAMGTKVKLALEMDLLPLPAIKSGMLYYF